MERGLFYPSGASGALIIGHFGEQAKPRVRARPVEGTSSAITPGAVTMFEAQRFPQTLLGVVLTTGDGQTLPDNTRASITTTSKIQSLTFGVSWLTPHVLLLSRTGINSPACNPAGQKALLCTVFYLWPKYQIFLFPGKMVRSCHSSTDLRPPLQPATTGTRTSSSQLQDKVSPGYESTPSNSQPKCEQKSAPTVPLEQDLKGTHPTMGHRGRALVASLTAPAWLQFRPPSPFALMGVPCTPILSVPTLFCLSGGTNEL